nr:hypothetical protein [Deltaproteobacteria bacterium]
MERTSSPRTRLHARVEHGGIGQRSPVTVELDPLDLAGGHQRLDGRRRTLPHGAAALGDHDAPGVEQAALAVAARSISGAARASW